MKDISRILTTVGILTTETIEDKFSTVARAVSKYLDSQSEGILYEVEVAKALANLRNDRKSNLTEGDIQRLTKPRINTHYDSLGVKSMQIQEAIEFTLGTLGANTVLEVNYQHAKVARPQKIDNRLILFKQDDKLSQYIQSRLSGPVQTKVVYSFSAPDSILTVRNDSVSQRAFETMKS
ncbi:MAG: hypothetical protein WCI72_03250 [archaeon]